MKAKVRGADADLVSAEAEVPMGLAEAFRARPFIENSAQLSRYLAIRTAARLPFEKRENSEGSRFADLGR